MELTPGRHAWYAALTAVTALLEVMDADLQADHEMPLAWYDVLVKVYEAPGHAIRMSELADQVLLSRSWITRRVTQLEAAGLLERRGVASDQRGVVAALTPQGLRTFGALERSHARSIERLVSRHLDDDDARLIAERLRAIGAAARAELRDAGALTR